MDLDDLEHNVRDGVHIASLAGAWTALVAGFGGLRLHDSALFFAPQLPGGIGQLAFHITFRSRRLRVEVRSKEATYYLLEGPPLQVWHHGDEITLSIDKAITRPIPPVKAGPRPTQPPGREARERGTRARFASTHQGEGALRPARASAR
jgi:alpha,alpha-trehalose phosphorylase